MAHREPKVRLGGAVAAAGLLVACVAWIGPAGLAADWPTYRHDPARSAASDEQLSPQLHLQWSRQYPPLIAAWLGEYPHLRFDASYEPVVMGTTVFLGSSDDDSVTALDTATGAVKWRFYANGPVRLAPVAWQGKVYFGADDGVVTCLDAAKGTVVWQFDTALSQRRGFIEGRLGTICPVRGGLVVEDGKVHLSAGIWAFEPCAFFTLDAATGKQMRRVDGFRAQGYLAAIGQGIYLPDGRMFIVGPGQMVAMDIYTGRILWEVRSALFTARTRRRGGCHTVGAPDALYVSTRRSVLRFDPPTGRLVAEFALPADRAKDDAWGRARIWRDTLIAGIVRGGRNAGLVALHRHSGKVLWSVKPESSFSHVAIGNGKVFAWDGSSRDLAALSPARRRGGAPVIPGRALKAFDARSGRELWRTSSDAVVDWLSYSEEMDVLIASTKKRIHAYRGRDGRERWHKYSEGIGFRGHPGRVWQKVILWHDWLIDQRGPGLAYSLLTGRQIRRLHPVTLRPAPWEFIRQGHHCNHAVGSENLLTFRSSNITYVDLKTLGTGTFPGVRSGCTNSLIPAGGILSSPMYAHLCSCGYEFFTSMAFARIPDAEAWTYRPNLLDFITRPGQGRAQRIGINLNGPGECRAPNGTLWFGLGGRQGYGLPGIARSWRGSRPFRLPVAQVQGDGPAWVFATGIEGPATIKVPLCRDRDVPEESHTVRLYFLEPAGRKPGERVFSVAVQGEEALKGLDVAKAAGGPMRGVVRELKGVKARTSVTVALGPAGASPVLCGIEVLNEGAGAIPPEVHHTVVQAPVGKATAVALRYTDFDGPGPYTFRVTRPPAKGTLSGRGPALAYTPKAGAFGTDSFAWVVHDGKLDSGEAVVAVKLLAPNVAPKAQDLQAQATAGRPVVLTLPFADPDEQPGNYRFELVTLPAKGSIRWQSLNRFVYTPTPDAAGPDRFTWKLNDGEADSNVAAATVLVKPDTQGPAVAWVDSAGPRDRITVVFTEPVASDEAAKPSSYAIDHGVKIAGATLADDGRAVTLATSPLAEGVGYSLTIRGLRDRAPKPNTIAADTRAAFRYVHVGDGLVGEYYEGKDFAGKRLGERVDPFIQVDWRRELPFPGIKQGQPYSVRWTGRLKADHTEKYMLYFFKAHEHNRNPVRIWVDGKLLASELYGPVAFEAGRTYDLKVELSVHRPTYYNDYYRLLWSSLSTPKQTIPKSNLGTGRPRDDAGR